MQDDDVIEHIINSLGNFALNDIRKIVSSDKNTLLASFILCSCFIEQVSGFRYAKVSQKTGKDMFERFVSDYLPNAYVPKQLREDLRNKLVHNYSLGKTYSLVEKMSDLHLKTLGNRTIINIENFVLELEVAFGKYVNELKQNVAIRANAIKWFEKYKILGMDNHDFFTYEQAEEIIKTNKQYFISFSKTETWPLYLISPIIVPSGSEFETIAKICTCMIDNKWGNKDALTHLSLFENRQFDVYIVCAPSIEPNIKLEVSFIKLSDYLERVGNAL